MFLCVTCNEIVSEIANLEKLSLIENNFYFFFFSFIVQVLELETRRIEQSCAAVVKLIKIKNTLKLTAIK